MIDATEAINSLTKPAEGPKPKVVEVIIRPLQDGHMVNLMAKVKEEDGTMTDTIIESNSVGKELRIELAHLQEAAIMAKVVGIVAYDSDQSAVLSVPLPSSDEPTTQHKQESKNEAKTPRKETPAAHVQR